MTQAVHSQTNPPAPKSQRQTVGDLESRAQKMAQIYQDLVETRKAFTERDETQFCEAVEHLSLQLSFLERDICQFEAQFAGDNKAAQQVQKIRQILKGSPLSPNAISRAEPKPLPTNFEQNLAKAEDAANQFEAFLELECDVPDAKQDLAINMHNQMKIVKQNDDFTFRKSKKFRDLMEKHDDLLRRAYAPKVSEATLNQFIQDLTYCATQFKEAARNADPVQKHLAAQVLEKQMNQYPTPDENFVPNTFRYKHPIFGEIDTDLSNVKAEFDARIGLEKQYDALVPHIDHKYTAKQVPLDGNCFFHSAAHFMPGTSAADVRRTIHRNMTQYSEVYRSLIEERIKNEPELRRKGIETVDQYLAFIEKNSSWGGKPELQALSDILGCPIVVRQRGRKDSVATFFPIHGIITNNRPLMFLNSGEGHFEPLHHRIM